MKAKEIELDKGKVALVDEEYYDEVLGVGNWYAYRESTGRYVATHALTRNGKKTTIRLHHFISRATPGSRVIFLNGNSLDCRKDNLLVCSPKQQKLLAKVLPKEGLKKWP